MKGPISFTLNGRGVSVNTEDDRTLLWVLRTDLALTGTKYGCGEGFCGACTVMVDGSAVYACQTLLKEVANKEVLTIEGLARGGELHPLQRAFIDHGAFQCGYCTSGMLLSAVALCENSPIRREMPSFRAWNATSVVAAHIKESSRPSKPLPGRRPYHRESCSGNESP